MTIPTHEQERQAILKEYPLTYFIAAAALFIVLGIAIGVLLFGQNSPLADADNSYFSNVYLTIISTAFTVIVIDRLNRRRDEQRDLRQLQEQLMRDAGSLSNEVAKNAVHQLSSRKWLTGKDGLLKRAVLTQANLKDAFLGGANLQDAGLMGANLQGADLWEANLQGAKLIDSRLNEDTTLPDNTKWTPGTDLNRFTDPNHPTFWRSNNPRSPAYRGTDAAPTAMPPPKS